MTSPLHEDAMAEGFFPLQRKHQSEGVPSTTPLPRGRDKPRAASESDVPTTTYRMGSLAELKLERFDTPAKFSCRVGFEKQKEYERRRLVCRVGARKYRATLSVDSGLAFATTALTFALVAGSAAAYLPATTPIAHNHALGLHTTQRRGPGSLSFQTAPVQGPGPDDPVAAASAKLRRATRYLNKGALGASANYAVEKALAFANDAHDGQYRKSGEDYVVHPIETACILAELKVDVDTVVAGLLHDVVEDTDWSSEDLCAKFGASVGAIVDGVTDVSLEAAEGEAPVTKDEKDEYNKRRLLLAMGTNLNVVLVKLADRVHNMRTLGSMPKHKREKKAKETLELFVPLAKAVGVAPLEQELRSLSAQHLSPFGDAAGEDSSNANSGVTGLAGQILGMANEGFAQVQCPALLDEFLSADEALRAADLSNKLASHRETWAARCTAADAPQLSSAAATPLQSRWLGGILGGSAHAEVAAGHTEAAAHLRAAAAAALAAGFAGTPTPAGATWELVSDLLAN